jgi:hypothetical protein
MANHLISERLLGGFGGNGLDYVSISHPGRSHVPGLRRKLRTLQGFGS